MRNYGITTFAAIGFFTLGSCMEPMSESFIEKEQGFNGSFEAWQNNLPVNWIVYTPESAGSGQFSISSDSIDFTDGRKSLKIEVKSCSGKGGRYSPGIAAEKEAVAGEKYHVSFWIKNEESNFTVKLSGVNATAGKTGPVLRLAETTKGWKKFGLDYTVPEKMDRLRLEINVMSPGTFRIDKVSIDKIS